MAIHDLATLPANSHVFVDTNIFYLRFRKKSITCDAFITRIAMGEIFAYVNIQVLSDLMHKLMLAEAFDKGYITGPPLKAVDLRKRLHVNRHLANKLTYYQQQFEDTLAIGIKVLHISPKLMVDTKVERATHGLMTGDSLHLGTMWRNPTTLTDIVTYDGDFAHIPGINVWKPDDVLKP